MTVESEKTRPSLSIPGVMLATWFGIGFLPKAPGTWGSAMALPFAWYIMAELGFYGLILATLAVFFIGIWASNVYMAHSQSHDPGPVVIDEVAGQWMVLIVVPQEWTWFLTGFVLFRIFDILKPWPVNMMDKSIKGGRGVMLDDIGAGVYAIVAIFALQWFMEVAY